MATANGVVKTAAAQEGPDFNPHGNYSTSTFNCTACHQPHTEQPDPKQACFDCHETVETHQEAECAACHEPHGLTTNAALIQETIAENPVEFDETDFGEVPTGICYTCHTTTEFHSAASSEKHYEGRDCTECHPHDAGFTLAPVSCTVCHGMPPETGAHERHFEEDIDIACTDCHQPVDEFDDRGHHNGRVDFSDWKGLADTDVCSTCHGSEDGVQEAKTVWEDGGAISDCLGCHNWSEPGSLHGTVAPAKGRYWDSNGHGQFTVKAVDCLDCHDPAAPHFGSAADSRLLASPQALCMECHGDADHAKVEEGAPGDLEPHGANGECNLCHDPHGTRYPAMLQQSQPRLCGTCHEDQVDPTVSFPKHARGADLQCSACHDPHLPTDEPAQVEGETCQTCHDDLPEPDAYTHPHQPYVDGRCADCHPSFHDNPDEPIALATQAKSCNNCHKDHGERVQQPHPEVAADKCLLCHKGHGSNQPMQLVQTEQDLCKACHANQFDEDHSFGEHLADELPSCTTCHSPHEPKSSGEQVLLACTECHDTVLAEPATSTHQPVLVGECSECHSEFHGQNPETLAEAESCTSCHTLEDGRITHEPVSEGECTTCHLPHSSSHPALLSAANRQLCGECHAAQARTFRASTHATQLSDQCSTCHQPHSGDFDNLLVSRTNRLCNTCHSKLPHGFHPVSGEGLSCISCHAPHGSAHEADLRAVGDALCLSCHDFSLPTAQN
ncbi:MAG: hypothetical protein GY759_24595 [Chloroflexi bacterium]|nr:hypothetical protein [Chloroflexota bacterium]